MHDVQTILPVGSMIVERYRVEGLLGKGGFGAVYLVSDQRDNGSLFAIKELVDTSKKERDRFAFECEVLKRLNHPALPRVQRVFEDDANYRAYMLMDYIDGSNLEELRVQQPEKRLPLDQVFKIMAPVMAAVSYLHKQYPPIIHRDIKPANIIVPDKGEGAVLVDLGIAKEYDKDSTTTAIRRCSPGYGAPEQYAMGTNPRTDIYGLGATFYALLTGEVPTDAFFRMTQIGSKHPDPLEPVHHLVPGLPLPVSFAIQRAMEINSNERFATVEAFWDALHADPGDMAPGALAEAEEPTDPRRPVVLAAPPVTSEAPDVPTVAVYRQRSPRERQTQRRSLFPVLVALAMLALLIGFVVGASLLAQFFAPANRTPATPTSPVQPSATVVQTPGSTTTPKSTPTAGTTPSPTSTPTAQPTVTPSPTGTPALSPEYNGTIVDQFTNPPTQSSMNLSQIKQNGANITGFLTLGPGLQGNGNFKGTVAEDGSMQFLVEPCCTHLPLFFTGKIQPDKSISGTYCAYDNGKCANREGYGTWSVTPVSQGVSQVVATLDAYAKRWSMLGEEAGEKLTGSLKV